MKKMHNSFPKSAREKRRKENTKMLEVLSPTHTSIPKQFQKKKAYRKK
jgi:hypothetical protein